VKPLSVETRNLGGRGGSTADGSDKRVGITGATLAGAVAAVIATLPQLLSIESRVMAESQRPSVDAEKRADRVDVDP
jgi:hypothetical protein